MSWDQHIKILQFAGALLAIPAALGAAYSAYRTYLATEPVCDGLKNSIVSTLERKVAADAKRALVQKDLGEFEKTCAQSDPAALNAFHTAVQRLEATAKDAGRTAPASPPRQPATAVVADAAHSPSAAASSPPAAAAPPVAAAAPAAAGPPAGPTLALATPPKAGTPQGGERRVWVALAWRESGHVTQVHFDGYPISDAALPPPGSVLTSRYPIPVFTEPQLGPNDPTKGAGRIEAHACVRVLSTSSTSGRLWAEIVSQPCP